MPSTLLSMLDATLAFQWVDAMYNHVFLDAPPQGFPEIGSTLKPYATADGMVAVMMPQQSAFAALCRALGRPDIAQDPRFCTPQAWSCWDSGMQRLLAQARPPKVVFCTSDLIAYGAHRLASEAGLQIGRDLVLIGFDDSPMNAWVAPWLHAVRVPYAAYGEAIVTALADKAARAIILPHELVIRA